MLDVAGRADGPEWHLNLSVVFPPVDETVVRLDSLVSEPGRWRLSLRAEPGWWGYGIDRQSKWEVLSVAAEDDVGGSYVSEFDGSHSRDGHEQVGLRFLPRLDPRAAALTLTFGGVFEEVSAELRLP